VTPGVLPFLRKARPDVVVLGGYYMSAVQLALLWCWASRTPYVLCCESHLLARRRPWIKWLKGIYVTPIVRRAAAFMALGKASREYLVSYGAATSRIFVLPNIPDVYSFHSAAQKARAATEGAPASDENGDGSLHSRRPPPRAVRFLYVGRLIKVKGLEYLLQAFRRLQDRHPTTALTIVGTGPLKGELKGIAEALRLKNTIFKGAVAHSALPAAYAAADVFVLPSVLEPYGTVVPEAMACELPLILSRQVGAAPDLLEDYRNGLLVREGDVDDLLRALEWMVEHAKERDAMGKHSWSIIGQWTYERWVAEYTHALRTACNQRIVGSCECS
jgi:glycosyltransferase involved in cell wall biosynthesis